MKKIIWAAAIAAVIAIIAVCAFSTGNSDSLVEDTLNTNTPEVSLPVEDTSKPEPEDTEPINTGSGEDVQEPAVDDEPEVPTESPEPVESTRGGTDETGEGEVHPNYTEDGSAVQQTDWTGDPEDEPAFGTISSDGQYIYIGGWGWVPLGGENEGNDISDWLAEHEGMTWEEAMEWLQNQGNSEESTRGGTDETGEGEVHPNYTEDGSAVQQTDWTGDPEDEPADGTISSDGQYVYIGGWGWIPVGNEVEGENISDWVSEHWDDTWDEVQERLRGNGEEQEP